MIRTLWDNSYLEVENGNRVGSTKISCRPKKVVDYQKFYDHSETGTIRSKLNDYCMDLEMNVLVANPYKPGKQTQQWKRKGEMIVNREEENTVINFNQGETYLGRVISHPIISPVTKAQLWSFEQA
jgi:hypothetical protein